MKELWDNLKQRPLVRVGVAYVMIGWVLMQVGEVMSPALNLPEWFLSAIAFVLILGLPVVLLIAWGLGNKPGDEDIDHRPLSGKNRLGDMALIAVMLAVLVFIVGNRALPVFTGGGFSQKPLETVSLETAPASAASSDPTPAAVSNAAPADQMPEGKSIAVLPFVDLSPEMDQEYFSDGISEELMNALGRVEGLRVAGRTSSFAFKNQNQDLREVGKKLQVTHLLEGSVRKQGDQVRITAQLIEASTGFHLWSENYDRSLDDIFSVQEEISQSIATNLELLLDDKTDGASVLAEMSVHPDAYEAYMQGRHQIASSRFRDVREAIALFEEAVRIDPGFTQAWASLAEAHLISPLGSDVDIARSRDLAELHALNALNQSDQFAEPYAILGSVYVHRRNYVAMQEMFDKALEINPDNITALLWHGYGLMAVGRTEEAEQFFERATILDPLQPDHTFLHATALLLNGKLDEAEKIARKAYESGMKPAAMALADIAYLRGESAKAQELATVAMRPLLRYLPEDEARFLLAGVFGSGETRDKAVEKITLMAANDQGETSLFLPNFLIMLGKPEMAFEVFEKNLFSHDQAFFVALWGPYGKEARQHPEFQSFAKRAGLLDYWATHGWPDNCAPKADAGRPEGEISFVCDTA